MPDSLLPPSWGSASFDERDLDAVLSGETADIPVVLGPVADTLAALRAAPAAAELRGEPAVMAEFRALGLGQARRADTLEFSVLAGDSPPRAARHRAHRRPGRPVSWHAGVLMGAAAVVLIVLIVAFSGSLPAPIARLARFVHPAATSSSAAHHTRHTQASSRHHGTEAPAHAPSVTSPSTPSSGLRTPGASPSSATRSQLCQAAYRGLPQHPWSRSSWAADAARWRQVLRYCTPYLKVRSAHGDPGADSPRSAKVPANTGQSQGNQGPGDAAARPAQGDTGSRSTTAAPVPGKQGGGPAPNP